MCVNPLYDSALAYTFGGKHPPFATRLRKSGAERNFFQNVNVQRFDETPFALFPPSLQCLHDAVFCHKRKVYLNIVVLALLIKGDQLYHTRCFSFVSFLAHKTRTKLQM